MMMYIAPATFIVPILAMLLIIAPVVWVIKKEDAPSDSDKAATSKAASKTMNIVWAVLTIPAIPVFFIFGLSTIMSIAAPDVSDFQGTLFSISAFLFWATPIVIIVSIILSVLFRRREKLTLSIAVQVAPIITILLAFLLLIAGFLS